MNLFAYVGNSPANWLDPWGWAKIVTRPIIRTIRGKAVIIGRHAYIRFDDGATAALNRGGGKTWVGTDPLAFTDPNEEAKWSKPTGVCDAALKDAVNKSIDADNPDADDVDGWPYDSNPLWGTNNSNDWVNSRLREAGGQDIVDWDGSWLNDPWIWF